MERLRLLEANRIMGCGFNHQFSVEETYPMHTHEDFFELFL